MYHKIYHWPVWIMTGAILMSLGCDAQGSRPTGLVPLPEEPRPQDPGQPPLPGEPWPEAPAESPPPDEEPPPPTPTACAPWKLVFLSAAQSVQPSSCSAEVAVQLQDSSGTPLAPDTAVRLDLSSSTGNAGQFFADAACTRQITSVSIASGDSTARFFFKEASIGNPSHAVSAAGLIRATQTQTIREPLQSSCRLRFPPSEGIACIIETPGPQYYVSAERGSDINPGTSPEQPWATLQHALQSAASGGTIRVAMGTYTTPEARLSRPLTVKGGYDANFSIWAPDRFPTTYTGRVTLLDDGAVFGGFRLIARPSNLGWAQSWHNVHAGSLIRNYVELVYTGSDVNHFTGVNAGAPQGKTSRVLCNDIYLRGSNPGSSFGLGTHALTFDANSGRAEASSNRICVDHNPSLWVSYAIAGYGSCNSAPSKGGITLTNNIIEAAQQDSTRGNVWGVHFYGCSTDMDVVLTSNTILSTGMALGGYAGSSGAVIRWKLTNNILFSEGSASSAADVGTNRIVSSQNNLIFGYADNTLHPSPDWSVGDDTSGQSSAATVFQSVPRGLFQLREGGAGVGRGLNVYGLGEHGSVTKDLAQHPRPSSGPWDRGALGSH